MRWRYINTAALCGTVAFFTQFCLDEARPGGCSVFLRSDMRSEFADDAHPFYVVYSPDGLELATPYYTEDGKRAYPGVSEVPEFSPSGKQLLRWQLLVRALAALEWLKTSAPTAFQTAAMAALLGLSALICCDRVNKNRNQESAQLVKAG